MWVREHNLEDNSLASFYKSTLLYSKGLVSEFFSHTVRRTIAARPPPETPPGTHPGALGFGTTIGTHFPRNYTNLLGCFYFEGYILKQAPRRCLLLSQGVFARERGGIFLNPTLFLHNPYFFLSASVTSKSPSPNL